MKVQDYIALPTVEQEAFLATLLDEKEKTTFLKGVAEYEWLEALRTATAKQAEDISKLLNCSVEPFIFVVAPGKDAAVGFLKVPDAKQSFKLLREVATNYDSGMEMIIKAQLVRKSDLEARSSEGTASDERFMDANGVYPKGQDALNFNLLRRAQELVSIYTDEFKKK